jgi:hypothetical protein
LVVVWWYVVFVEMLSDRVHTVPGGRENMFGFLKKIENMHGLKKIGNMHGVIIARYIS